MGLTLDRNRPPYNQPDLSTERLKVQVEAGSEKGMISRRGLLAKGMLVIGSSLAHKGFAQTPTTAIEPFDVGGGIEVRDFRIFPTPDVMRFIVEIHNTTDEPIDTPALGVTLNHLPKSERFGVASPASEVLHPHSSGVLFGVAPAGLKTDADWGEPQWSRCNEIRNERAHLLNTIDMELNYTLYFFDDGRPLVTAFLTNHGPANNGEFSISGMVRDASGRVCGILKNWNGWYMEHGEVLERNFGDYYFTGHIGSPYVLIDDAGGIDVSLFIQPRVQYNPISCSIV